MSSVKELGLGIQDPFMQTDVTYLLTYLSKQ